MWDFLRSVFCSFWRTKKSHICPILYQFDPIWDQNLPSLTTCGWRDTTSAAVGGITCEERHRLCEWRHLCDSDVKSDGVGGANGEPRHSVELSVVRGWGGGITSTNITILSQRITFNENIHVAIFYTIIVRFITFRQRYFALISINMKPISLKFEIHVLQT